MSTPLRLFTTILIAWYACNSSAAGTNEPKKSAPKSGKSTPASKRAHATKIVTGPLYATRPEALAAADEIAQKLQIDSGWVRQAIGQAHRMPGIARAAAPPPVGTPKNWTIYRSRFIDAVRIRAGVQFWQAHRTTLERAEQEFGVPANIVVGVIGVETIYGQQTGTYRVMDALCTLAFDFPQEHPRAAERAAFFRSELEAFLKLTHRTGTEPLALRGSYAGAMGLPQFMPSSWDKYAIDFDGDARVDLFLSAADVIGSIANYFKAFQWQRGMATHYPVRFNMDTLDKARLLAPDILPSFSPATFAALGVELEPDAQRHPGPLALVELQNGNAPPIYLAGTENFYAITRYNWSSYYALAVIELGQAVADAMPK